MKIVCLSDTHNCNDEIAVPDGDILIHSGDATNNGTPNEIAEFARWFSSLPHKYKIFIAGKHDFFFEDEQLDRKIIEYFFPNCIYLQDSFVEIEGLKIYGSPWQPRFFDWAFNLNRGAELAEKWKLIPHDIDILITHGPPNGILDEVPRKFWVENTGCEELMKRIEEISVFGRLKLHVFGHIHCGYGQTEKLGVKFVNASTCDEEYKPVQPPIVVEIAADTVV